MSGRDIGSMIWPGLTWILGAVFLLNVFSVDHSRPRGICIVMSYSFSFLKPFGRLGITDIAVGSSLPPELNEVLMKFLCVSREIPLTEYPAMVEASGFRDVRVRDESSSLGELVETVRKRLFLAELLSGIGKLSLNHDQLYRAKRLVHLARDAVEQGRLRCRENSTYAI